MGERIGLRAYEQEEGYQKPYSDMTGEVSLDFNHRQLIDQEVGEILDRIYKDTKAMMETKRPELEKLAERLLEKESVNLTDIVDCLGERPFPLKENIREYLDEMRERQTHEAEKEAEAAEAEPIIEVEKEEDADIEKVEETISIDSEDAADKKQDK